MATKLTKGFLVSTLEPSFRWEFLLNPDGFSDNKDAGYVKTKVPNISHPVYSFSSGGERIIEFDLELTRDLSTPPIPPGLFQKFGKKILSTAISIFGNNLPFRPNARDPLSSITGAVGRVPILGDLLQGSRGTPEFEKFDITLDVLFLRSFLYPAAEVDATMKKTAPHKVLFNFGPFYQNTVCVMTKCDIDWKIWSPELIPLKAKASIKLEEVIERSVTREDVLAQRPTVAQKSSANGGSGLTASTILKSAVGVGAIAAIAVLGGQAPTGSAVIKRFGK